MVIQAGWWDLAWKNVPKGIKNWNILETEGWAMGQATTHLSLPCAARWSLKNHILRQLGFAIFSNGLRQKRRDWEWRR